MKRFTAIIAVLSVILLTITSISCSSPTPKPSNTSAPAPTQEPAKVITLRLASAWPAQDPITQVLDGFAERFNARAGGKYVMESHSSESLIKVMESVDAVRLGTVELAAWAVGIFGALDPRFTELPFLYDNEQADAAAQSFLTPMYNEFTVEKFNQKVLTNFTTASNELISKNPIKTLDDWDGLLGMSYSPTMSTVIESLGGSPVPLSFTESYTSLDKGVVEACFMVPSMILMFGTSEIAKNITCGYFIPGNVAVSINMDVWNSLPQDIQNILIEEGLKTQQLGNDVFIENYNGCLDTLREQGVEIFNLSQAERDAWEAKVQPAKDKMVAEMGDFGERILEIADKVNNQY